MTMDDSQSPGSQCPPVPRIQCTPRKTLVVTEDMPGKDERRTGLSINTGTVSEATLGEASDRPDEAHKDFSQRTDTTLN